ADGAQYRVRGGTRRGADARVTESPAAGGLGGGRETQELAGRSRLERRAADRPRVRRGTRDEWGASFREDTLREIDVVLEPDARVAPERHRELRHRLLVPSHRGHRPARAFGDERAEETHV